MTAGCALNRRIARDFIEKARAADLLKKASGPSPLPPIPGSVPLRTRDLPVLRPRPAPPYASELSFLLLTHCPDTVEPAGDTAQRESGGGIRTKTSRATPMLAPAMDRQADPGSSEQEGPNRLWARSDRAMPSHEG